MKRSIEPRTSGEGGAVEKDDDDDDDNDNDKEEVVGRLGPPWGRASWGVLGRLLRWHLGVICAPPKKPYVRKQRDFRRRS